MAKDHRRLDAQLVQEGGGGSGSSPEVSVISSKSSIFSLALHEQHPLHYFSLFSALLFELTHVQVAPSRLSFLRLLDAQRRHQPEARLAVGEDPHHPTAALYLLALSLSWPLVVRIPRRWLSGNTRQLRHSSTCSSRCSATFGWLSRHRSASSEASRRAVSLLVGGPVETILRSPGFFAALVGARWRSSRYLSWRVVATRVDLRSCIRRC